ncbi:MAG: S8 family serine peptidase, partial [Flavobacteriales bacterium]|nr:S8 family serine peptidase [Flavobacteriales bacterium]
MRRFLFLMALVISVQSFAQSTMPHESGEIIVQISNPELIQEVVNDLSTIEGQETGLEVIKELSKPMQVWHLKFNPDAIDEVVMLRTLKQHDLITIAQFNHFVQKRETIPNDPSFAQQWHHMNNADNDIDSELAWDVTTGGTTAFGDEIVVCVIEGGNLNHPDLVDNKWVNELEIPNNGIDDDDNGYVDDYEGWNVQSNDDNFAANNGHGTNVFGMIGAKGNNGANVSGINWDVKMMAVAGQNIFNESNVIQAYTYPLVQRQLYNSTGGTRGAFVVATNASWGIDQGDIEDVPIWSAFYDTLGTHGILNCGATTNSSFNVDQVGDIPTAAPSDYMISVTATNDNDVRTFSGFGQTTIDLGAPGEDVVTTSGASGITSTSGTSFASPLTAGAIALIYSSPCPSFASLVAADPQAGADYVRQVLFDGTDPVPNLQDECVTGGRLNVNNSIQLIMQACSFVECLAPFGVDAVEPNPGEYTLSWNAFGEVENFLIRYREVGSDIWNEVTQSENTIDLNELTFCTEYEFQVASECEDGTSEYSEVFTWTTNGCCELPSADSIVVSDVDASSATVSWPFVLAAEQVDLQIAGTGGAATVIEGVDGLSYTFENLNACESYSVSISITCAGGTVIPFGSEVTFNTLGCGACTDFVYCNSTGDTEEEWIESVKVNTADTYESGANGGYGDFTGVADAWEMNIGDNSMTLTPEFAPGESFNENFRVWIDFNQDGSFNGDELVIDVETEVEIDADFEIPEGTPLGNTRMRVSMKWAGFGQGPALP